MKSIILVLFISLFPFYNDGGKELEKIEEELLNTDKEFASASIEHGAAKAFNIYLAEDALQFPNGRDVIEGNMNVYKHMKENDSLYTLKWDPQFAQVSSSGDMGWTWGYYKISPTDNSEEISSGKYLNVWIKDEDGKWKVAADIGNSGP